MRPPAPPRSLLRGCYGNTSSTARGSLLLVPIAVCLIAADEDSAVESRVESEETVLGIAELPAGRSVEDANVRSACGAGTRDDVRLAVGVHVHHRHPRAASERWAIGEEIIENGGVGVTENGSATEGANFRSAARARAGDNVGLAVSVEVAGSNVDAAGERGVV